MNSKEENYRELYQKALTQLATILTKVDIADDIRRDASIQRFEFTFELAWKTMKDCCTYKGLRVNNPRDSIKGAFKVGLIDNDPVWLDMLETRSQTSHLYKESLAIDVYLKLPDYQKRFENLAKRLLEW